MTELRLDLHVLALMGNRETHRRYHKFVLSTAMDQTAQELIQALGRYYDQFPQAELVDWGEFYAWLTSVDMAWKKAAVKQIWHHICAQLQQIEMAEPFRDRILETLNERHYAAELREIVEDIVEGRGRRSLAEAATLLKEYQESAPTATAGKHDKHFVSGPLGKTLEDSAAEPGLEWRLEELNVGYGPLRPGDLVMLAARPGIGKTSLVLYNVVYMAAQLPPGQCVIYFGNEEDGERIRERAVQAALSAPGEAIMARTDEAVEAYDRLLGGPERIKVYSNRHLTIEEIVEVCEEYKPGLIIVDQLRKVEGFESVGEGTVRFQKLFMEARDLASRLRAPLIAVHQADATADGKLRLKACQLEGVKTEVQGELDLLIMMGCADPGSPTRMLTIAKTKSRGGPRTDKTYKHGSFPLQFDDDTAVFTGEFRRPQ